ncbi:MAG: lysylphosphatidylglycerol synthase transmembrane domain-containing protein [Pseudomonadota bacterium]
MNQQKQVRRGVFTGLALAIAAYAAIVLYAGRDELMRSIGAVDARLWLGLLALTVLHFALRFARWRLYLSLMGHKPPLGFDVAVYMSGFALTATPGRVGETWRGLYLSERGVPFSDPTAAFVAERYTDLGAMAVLSVLGLSLLAGALWPLAIVTALLVAGFVVLRRPNLAEAIERRSAGGRLERLGAGAARMLRVAGRLLTPRVMVLSLGVALAAWTLQGAALWLLLTQSGHDITAGVAIGAYAIAMCVGALSFLPGGLGTMEATLIALLIAAGLDPAAAASATIVIRVVTLWFAIGLGVAATALLEADRWRRSNGAPLSAAPAPRDPTETRSPFA